MLQKLSPESKSSLLTEIQKMLDKQEKEASTDSKGKR